MKLQSDFEEVNTQTCCNVWMQRGNCVAKCDLQVLGF